jgi:hypothetical protein
MNIRMTIPKNRDSSGTAILYIVGASVFIRRANYQSAARPARNHHLAVPSFIGVNHEIEKNSSKNQDHRTDFVPRR